MIGVKHLGKYWCPSEDGSYVYYFTVAHAFNNNEQDSELVLS